VPEHLLNAPQVGAALEQVRGEGVPEKVRVNALRLEPGFLGESPQDEKCAGAGQRAAARVQEELGPVAAVELGTAEREVAPNRLRCRPAERDESLLTALAEDADDPLLDVDPALLESDGLGDAQASAIHQLDERTVAEGARRRPDGCVDQALGLRGGQRPREAAGSAR